jgi:hypothetical protein
MDGTQRSMEGRTVPELISQLTGDLATLVRKESELVRTELTEKVHTAGKAVGEIAAGGVLLLAALLVLLQALVAALATFMGPIWASLLVGLLVLALGVVLIRGGMKLMKPEHLKPDRSARQLQKDAQLMKGSS